VSKRNLPKADIQVRPGVRSDVSADAVKRWNPDIKVANEASGENSISVMDPIGENWFGDGVTAKRIAAALRQIGENDVVVNINSPGGDFFEGLAIYNLLREHNGAVTVKILGMAASAASFIAMAGDDIQIARASFLMIHNTQVYAAGDRHDLREVADWLDPFDQALVDIYASRTGLGEKELGAMLDRETWIGGSAAVEQGFADGLLPSDEIDTSTSNSTSTTPMAAQKKMDLHLTRAGVSRTDRRELVAALKGGKPSAAPTSMPRAAEIEAASSLLETLKSI